MREPTYYGGRRPAPQPAPQVPVTAPKSRWRVLYERHQRPVWATGGALAALAAVLVFWALMRGGGAATDTVVLQEPKPQPSVAAQAYAAILPSVVKVRGFGEPNKGAETPEAQVGAGVVIVDNGIILTNLHVVAGARRVTVVFADDLESEATVVGVRPEHDLAVLQAATIPDDLVAATMRSTRDLLPGDPVVAVGFPFGIGPSASAGVVSGLRREFYSKQGQRLLTNLIQFDAAVNPGSSGGPLVTAGGEVVGIVTAILNPTEQRVFVGIGFAVPIENAAAAAGLPPF
jgi:S1-C subfamily serine protease